MSSGFDQREEGFETQFKLEADQKFRAAARRDKMLGRWAAEKMGLAGDEIEKYVIEVVKSDLEEPGDEDVFRKVLSDLEKKGCPETPEELRKVMDDFHHEACRDISRGG